MISSKFYINALLDDKRPRFFSSHEKCVSMWIILKSVIEIYIDEYDISMRGLLNVNSTRNNWNVCR